MTLIWFHPRLSGCCFHIRPDIHSSNSRTWRCIPRLIHHCRQMLLVKTGPTPHQGGGLGVHLEPCQACGIFRVEASLCTSTPSSRKSCNRIMPAVGRAISCELVAPEPCRLSLRRLVGCSGRSIAQQGLQRHSEDPAVSEAVHVPYEELTAGQHGIAARWRSGRKGGLDRHVAEAGIRRVVVLTRRRCFS